MKRSPDFAVSYTTSLKFMVEVTRMRVTGAQEGTRGIESPNSALTAPLLGDRFTDMLCSKLGQLLPQRSNLLLVSVEAVHLTHPDLHAAMLRIQQRAEGNDASVVHRQGFRDRADFFHH